MFKRADISQDQLNKPSHGYIDAKGTCVCVEDYQLVIRGEQDTKEVPQIHYGFVGSCPLFGIDEPPGLKRRGSSEMR
jgi:hypothetical protein